MTLFTGSNKAVMLTFTLQAEHYKGCDIDVEVEVTTLTGLPLFARLISEPTRHISTQ